LSLTRAPDHSRRDTENEKGFFMSSIQGEFANKAAAQKAMTSLADSGVATEHMRIWNIIPTQNHGYSNGDSAARGTLIGGALGGAPGLAIGAVLGGVLDNDSGESSHLPESSGVRLVVDIVPNSPNIASLLQQAGAANIHQING
jgi:hypothetical protein